MGRVIHAKHMKFRKNYAYIDTQNLNLGMRDLGWKLDLRRYRRFLEDKYGVQKAYMFIGYMPEYEQLYKAFHTADFVVMFKPLSQVSAEGKVKGNIDADLVLQVMLDYPEFDRALIVTSDGDFQGLVNHLYNTNKLEVLMSPNPRKVSNLLVSAAREKIAFIEALRDKLEYRPKARRVSLEQPPKNILPKNGVEKGH